MIAQLIVLSASMSGETSSDEVIGGMFVHDVWNTNVRRLSGQWRWLPKTKHLAIPDDNRWVTNGGISGRWVMNGRFLDLYMFQTKVAFLCWWGGDSMGSGIPRYPLQTGALLVENLRDSFNKKPPGPLANGTDKWFPVGFSVNYVNEPSAIPWHYRP